jgi:hypothetical protein
MTGKDGTLASASGTPMKTISIPRTLIASQRGHPIEMTRERHGDTSDFHGCFMKALTGFGQ